MANAHSHSPVGVIGTANAPNDTVSDASPMSEGRSINSDSDRNLQGHLTNQCRREDWCFGFEKLGSGVADMYACGVIVNGRFRGASGNLREKPMRRVAGDADGKGRPTDTNYGRPDTGPSRPCVVVTPGSSRRNDTHPNR